MAKRDLVTIRLDRRELELIREGLDLVVKDREFTIKVQPQHANSAIAAHDTLAVIASLRQQFDDVD